MASHLLSHRPAPLFGEDSLRCCKNYRTVLPSTTCEGISPPHTATYGPAFSSTASSVPVLRRCTVCICCTSFLVSCALLDTAGASTPAAALLVGPLPARLGSRQSPKSQFVNLPDRQWSTCRMCLQELLAQQLTRGKSCEQRLLSCTTRSPTSTALPCVKASTALAAVGKAPSVMTLMALRKSGPALHANPAFAAEIKTSSFSSSKYSCPYRSSSEFGGLYQPCGLV